MKVLRTAWEWLDSRSALRIVQFGVVLAILSIGILYVQDRQQAACLQRYNEETSRISRQRAEATNSDWAAMDDLIRKSQAGGKPYAEAAQAYLDNRDRTLQQRQDNPLTPPPSDFCS